MSQIEGLKEIRSEADLCTVFITNFSKMDGWTCYPEAGGFDILAVHEDGRQIGVEAKLTLNAKVAEQILPGERDDYNEKPGPDYRLVIVHKLTTASEGIARMLAMLGIRVITPRQSRSSQGEVWTFGEFHNLLEARGQTASYGHQYLFDWNPATRCTVPSVLQNLPAGVPSPLRITPWKEAAVKVLALLRKQGFITAKQISNFGIGVTIWTQPQGNKQAWLAKGSTRGQWIETEFTPPYDTLHPELFALASEALEGQTGPLL